MPAYYNEIDPYAAQWLRNLIAAGHIAPGDVDERSIEDIRPSDLAGYTQCHFFAGIGVWSRALRGAGWSDDRPVWTGSCPCQPFSAAGKGAGFDDERHLWPAFYWLIEQCRPPVVFGEQVASPDGLKWLNLVQADLEGAGYRTGAADLCAAGVGAPHIRQRLYWVADADHERSVRQHTLLQRQEPGRQQQNCAEITGRSKVGRLDNNNNKGLEGHSGGYQTSSRHGQGSVRPVAKASESGRVADAEGQRQRADEPRRDCSDGIVVAGPESRRDGGDDGAIGGLVQGPARPTHGHWRDADWLFCRDGKWRPVEPGTFPLAHGAAARVGRLRAYGNAIVPQVAQAFIEAYL